MIISGRTTLCTKLHAILIFFLLFSTTIHAKSAPSRITREEYIDIYRHIAIEHQQHYGIPASITMAQGILESDSGNSVLSRKSNNHFGIKCKSNWTGRSVKHDDDAPGECFRAYDRVEQSYEDHARFLDESPRYDSLFDLSPIDYRRWARGLKAAGYATAPDYAPRLIKIIEDYKLYLLDAEAEGGAKAYDAMLAAKGDTNSEPANPDPTTKGLDPNNYWVSISSYNGYAIYKTNRTRHITAKAGDSYASIAKQFNMPKKSLAKYNDSSATTAKLIPDEVVYIEQKQSKWRGNTHSHRVLQGETLRSISQSYAIRLRSLRKLNDFKRKDEVATGVIIKIK